MLSLMFFKNSITSCGFAVGGKYKLIIFIFILLIIMVVVVISPSEVISEGRNEILFLTKMITPPPFSYSLSLRAGQ